MIGEGRSINVTLIFGLDRYDEVMEAYLRGLEALVAAGRQAELPRVASVASFFVSRVDTEVDRRLEALAGGEEGDPAVLGLRGTGAVAQAQVAYEHFHRTFTGERWEALRAHGGAGAAAAVGLDLHQEPHLLRPALRRQPDRAGHGEHHARANAAGLRGPRHPAPHGRRRPRRRRRPRWPRLADAGVDMIDVEQTLEDEGVHSFAKSFDELLQSLTDKAATF